MIKVGCMDLRGANPGGHCGTVTTGTYGSIFTPKLISADAPGASVPIGALIEPVAPTTGPVIPGAPQTGVHAAGTLIVVLDGVESLTVTEVTSIVPRFVAVIL